MRQKSSPPEECRQACLASPFLDGELDGAEANRFLRHLFHCQACRLELRWLRRVSQLLQSNGRLEPWVLGPEEAIAAERVASEPVEAQTLAGERRERVRRGRPEPKPNPSPSSAPALAGVGRRGR